MSEGPIGILPAGQLIPNPGGPAGESATILIDIGSVLMYSGDPTLILIGAVLEAIGYLIEILADIVQALIALFSGRPKDEATLQVGQRMLQCPHACGQMFGNNLLRLAHQFDVLISSNSPENLFWLNQLNHQFTQSMVATGVDLTRARAILTHLYSRQIQAGGPFPPELTKPIGDQFTLNIPGKLNSELIDKANQFIKQGASANDAIQRALKWMWRWGPPPLLLNARWGQRTPLGSIPPPPPPPPPIEPPPPPIAGQPDPEGDEITNTLCEQMQANTNAIIYALQQAAGGLGGGLGSIGALSSSIVDAIKAQTDTLQSILRVLPNLAPTPAPAPAAVDLSAILIELTCMCESLTTLASAPGADLSQIVAKLDQLRTAIFSTPGPDIADLKDAILHSGENTQIPNWIKQQLVAANALSSSDAQLLGDPAFVGVKTKASIVHLLPPPPKGGAFAGPVAVGGSLVHGDWIPRLLEWFLKNGVEWIGKGTTLDPAAKKAWVDLGNRLLADFRGVFGNFGSFAQDTLRTGASPPGDVFPSAAVGNFNAMLGNASGLAAAAFSAASVGGLLLGEHSRHLNYFAALFAMGAGYDAMAEGALDAFIEPLVTVPSRQHFRAMYRSEIPGANLGERMFARGIIDTAKYKQLIAAEGLRSDFESATLANAYRGMSPRIMLRIIESGLFSDAEVADELTFAAMRPVSQKRLISAATYLATQPQRSALRATLENFYEAGLISDTEMVHRIDASEHNVDRDSLILDNVHLKKQIALAREYEAGYSREFIAGLTDQLTYQAQLENLGMQPPDVAARLFRDQSRIDVTTAIAVAREQRAQARVTAETERRAAIEAFRNGTINSVALTAALLATGLTPVQAAAIATYQVLALAGVIRWIYGLQLPPKDAALLKQRVTALTDQRKRQLLSDAGYVAALQALKLPDRVINALQAAANATISPKTAAILTPVSTA